MKIGILTYHSVPNFGAQLQTLSTFCYLKNQGHEPIVINWYPRDLENLYSWISDEQNNAHNQFLKSYLTTTALCRTETDLLNEVLNQKLEAIILGSDALFKYIPIMKRLYLKMGKRRPRLVFVNVPSVEKLHNNPFLGSFISKLQSSIPVSVYAVSSQNCHFNLMTPPEKRLMKSYLKMFDFISVRDSWTQKMVKEISGYNADVYPDPVFAFNNNVKDLIPTKNEILKKYNITNDYILLSFRTGKCSDDYIQTLAEEVKKAGYLPVGLAMPEGIFCGNLEFEIPTPLSPMDWYALIKYSSGYIGERMHPIVVALHNAVPCYAFDEYGASLPDNVIFPKIGKWEKVKSKTYHIMQAANLNNNWFGYGAQETLPIASEVINKLLTVDKSLSEKFANKQLERYITGMSSVLKSFNQ